MQRSEEDLLHVQKQREHFRERAKERFGLKIDKQMRARIVKDIERGRAQFLCDQGEDKALYRLTIGKYVVKVAYNKAFKEPITVLNVGKLTVGEFRQWSKDKFKKRRK